MEKRKIELFTAGCFLCDDALKALNSIACRSCDVTVYDISKGCETNECREKAKLYGIKRVPAVVVDGKLLDCCHGGPITEEALKAAGVGSNA